MRANYLVCLSMSPKYTMPLFQPAPPSPEQHKPASMEAQRSARLTVALGMLLAAIRNMEAIAMQQEDRNKFLLIRS